MNGSLFYNVMCLPLVFILSLTLQLSLSLSLSLNDQKSGEGRRDDDDVQLPTKSRGKKLAGGGQKRSSLALHWKWSEVVNLTAASSIKVCLASDTQQPSRMFF